MYSLGIDIGSSSIKVSVLDVDKGCCVCSSTNPGTEMPISAPRKGWAEQDPGMWWKYVCEGIRDIATRCDLSKTVSVGVTYQMHGLVAVDKDLKPVRDSIIWCDSRAVGIGSEAFDALGGGYCLEHLLNSPGNFTASKLAWVKNNEPDTYGRIWKFMLPGDYIIYRLTGEIATTETGLSEQILWDFKENAIASPVIDHFGINRNLIPDVVPSIGVACRISKETENLLGIPAGVPVSYRAGDQPNNAFSLNVLNPGEIAATGGTSGVVYAVTDVSKSDPQSRVNTFLHVNHTSADPRLGVLLCINGTGIINSWTRKNYAPDMSYSEMDRYAETAPVGADGLLVIPFGNGAERVLANRNVFARMVGLDLVRHHRNHVMRAAQEGVAFAFRYGIDIMKDLGLQPNVIRAGRANMFLSPLFSKTLSTVCDARIELFNTDGSLGAARGAALGAGLYSSPEEAFSTLTKVDEVVPSDEWKPALEESYGLWKEELENNL